MYYFNCQVSLHRLHFVRSLFLALSLIAAVIPGRLTGEECKCSGASSKCGEKQTKVYLELSAGGGKGRAHVVGRYKNGGGAFKLDVDYGYPKSKGFACSYVCVKDGKPINVELTLVPTEVASGTYAIFSASWPCSENLGLAVNISSPRSSGKRSDSGSMTTGESEESSNGGFGSGSGKNGSVHFEWNVGDRLLDPTMNDPRALPLPHLLLALNDLAGVICTPALLEGPTTVYRHKVRLVDGGIFRWMTFSSTDEDFVANRSAALEDWVDQHPGSNAQIDEEHEGMEPVDVKTGTGDCEQICVGNVLKQMRTGTGLLAFEQIGTGFKMRFYWPSQFEVPEDHTFGGDLYPLISGAVPLRTWLVDKPSPNSMIVTDAPGTAGAKTTTWTFTNGAWEMSESDSPLFQSKKTAAITLPDGTSGTERTMELLDAGHNPLKREISRFDANDRLVWYSEGIGSEAMSSEYHHPANPLNDIEWMQRSDGYFEKYSYIGDKEILPYTTVVVRPWLDQSFATATESTARATRTRREESDGGILETVTEKLGGVTIGMTTRWTFTELYSSVNSGFEPIQTTITREFVRNASGELVAQNPWTEKRFVMNASPELLGMPIAEVFQDGRTKSFSYTFGTYNESTEEFVPEGTGPHLRVQTVHGRQDSSGQTIVGESTKEISFFDAKGRALKTEDWVSLAFEQELRVKRTYHGYDAHGHEITTSVNTKDVPSGLRTTYSAQYDGDKLLWEVNETGIKTTYTDYDLRGRALTVTREATQGDAAAPSVPALVTRKVYDLLGRQTDETLENATGSVLQLHHTGYDTRDRVISENNGTFLMTTQYSGNIETKTLPGGATIVTEQYPDGQIKSISGSGAVAATYSRALVGTLIRETETSGTGTQTVVRIMERNDLGQTLREKVPGPAGGWRSYGYDTSGRLNLEQLDGVTLRTTAYDEGGNQTTTIYALPDQERTETQLTHYVEVNGAIWQETTRADGSAMREQLSGLANNEISIRQSQAANGRTFTTTTTVDRADAKVTTASADSAMTNTAAAISRGGLVVSATSSGYSGATVTHYDALGRVLNVQDAGIGTTTDITYDPATGALATVQTSGTGLSTSASNSYYTASEASPGRLKSRTVDGVTTYYSYSSRGELTAQWGATYPVKYEYDSAGRLWKLHTYHTEPGTSPSAWPAGDVTEWIYYQGSTLLQQKKDFANQAAAYEYNNAGRLSKRTWARDVQTTYFYNQAGEMRLTQYNDGLTANVSVTRDNRGRIATINDGTGLRTLRYAASGEVEAEESASGRRLQWSYDVGRKSGYALWDQGQWQTWGGWGYDGATGHMSGVSVPAFGGSPPANWIGYHYSGGQVLPDTTTLGSIVTTRTPDGLGRLQNIRTTVNGTVPGPGLRHGYHYDAAGRHDVVTREDQSTWNYAYNGRSEVTDGIKKWTGGTAVAGEQYGYAFDAIGNRTSETLNARGTTWTYTTLNNALRATHTVPPASDALDVLGEADAAATVRVNSVNATRQGTHFHRAVAGPPRLLTQPRWLTVDVEEDKGAGGLTHANGQMFVRPRGEVMAYDVDGNLISDGHWSYTWDGENRLIEMKSLWDTNTWSKRERLVFRYDSQSRRTQKEYYTRTSSTATWDFQRRNHYIYDGWNLIAEYSETPNTQPGTLNLLHTYHWGLDLSGSLQNAGGVGGLLLMVDRSTPASQTCFYCYDGNGNVVGLLNVTDPANPAIGAEYEYGAFGEPLRETGAIAASNPFRFSTKYHDTETGLAYYGYRYYQPLTGRWISRDPIQERGGANLYAQSLNDGVNRFDPDGEESVNAQIMKTDGVIVIVSGPEDNTSQNNPVKPSGGVVYVPILDQAHINFETVQQKKRDAIKEYEEKEKKRCCKHIHLDTHYSSTAADAKSYLQREAHFHFLAAHGLKGGAPPDLTGLLFSTGAPDKNNKYWGKAYPISDAVPGNVNSGEINVHACYDAGLPNSVGGVRVVKISNTWDENNKNKFYTAFKKAVTSLCSCNPQ